MQSLTGQRAFKYYQEWFNAQRRGTQTVETFLISSHFNAFIKFTEFCHDTGIQRPLKYIELMVNKGISPQFWSLPEAYTLYLEQYINNISPLDQVIDSCETMLNYAVRHNADPTNVYEILEFGDFLRAFYQKKISPWFVVCSDKFLEWTTTLHEDQRSTLDKLVNPTTWMMKLDHDQALADELMSIIDELGL